MTERVCVPEIEKKIVPNTWLTEGREKLGLDREEFGNMCGCSVKLVTMLEEGTTITHPLIAAVLVRVVGGTVEQYNMLVHKDRHTGKIPKVKIPKLSAAWKRGRTCPECGKAFIADKQTRVFCSKKCATTNNQRMRWSKRDDKKEHRPAAPAAGGSEKDH